MIEFKECIDEYKIIKSKSKDVKVKIVTSQDASQYFRDRIMKEDIEVCEMMYALFLNTRSNVVGSYFVSKGSQLSTIVDVKTIAKIAIDTLSNSVIICHNHPSGNTQPSDADKAITSKLKQGLGFFDIKLIDHIILTKDSYFSFADEGII